MIFFFNKLSAKKYLIVFILCLLFSSLFYLPHLLFLKGMDEYKPIQKIVEQQLDSLKHGKKIIYGSGIRAMNYYYKKELMNNIHPDVIALGSSRVMQFRQKMFSSSFVNLGGIMNSIDAGLISYKDVINSKPKIVILGIDFWWFNENFQNKDYKEIVAPEYYKPKSSDLNIVKDWLKEGKLTYTQLLKGIFNFSDKAIGVTGVLESNGFGPDGSYYYTSNIIGNKEHHDIGFKDTLTRIEKGERRFQYGIKLSQTHFKKFTMILDEFQHNGIEVILFFPPLSTAANHLMNKLSEKYLYIDKLKKALDSAGYQYYDYSDATILDSSDCEFIDGFHGGDVTYAKILRDLAKKKINLARYINSDFLDNSIERYQGFAFIPDKQIVMTKEIDFIGLGCLKKSGM